METIFYFDLELDKVNVEFKFYFNDSIFFKAEVFEFYYDITYDFERFEDIETSILYIQNKYFMK